MHHRHGRTWLTKHRETQRDITRLCLFMAFIAALHLVMREILIFSMTTLKMPTRLTMLVENFPYDNVNIIIVIACLTLICALVHAVAAIGKRWQVKMITVSLVVSCCCLVATGLILRRALEFVSPQSIARLDPSTVIVDVDVHGRLTMYDVPFGLRTFNAYVKAKAEKEPDAPMIVCGDYRARFRDVWKVVDICSANGVEDVSFARRRGFERYRMPPVWVGGIEDPVTNTTSSVLIHSGGYVLDGSRVDFAEIDETMKAHAEEHRDNRYIIKITGDAPYDYMLQTLRRCEENGVTNLLWMPL